MARGAPANEERHGPPEKAAAVPAATSETADVPETTEAVRGRLPLRWQIATFIWATGVGALVLYEVLSTLWRFF